MNTSNEEPRRRFLPRLVVVALILLLVDQAILRFALSDGELGGSRIAPFSAVPSEPITYDEAIEPDEELGWRAARGTFSNGRTGTRHVVVVGGSRALCEGEANWSTLVENEVATLRVTNLAVRDHAIDQALLIARADGYAIEPDELWLCFEPDVALFATTSYPPLVQRDTEVRRMKPRFRLANEDDSVELVPFAGTAPENLEGVIANDPWASGECLFGTLAIPGLGESFAMSRIWITSNIDRRLQRAQQLKDEDSRALLSAIVATAAREATNRGARFRLVVLPGPRDLQRGPYWTHLVDDLRSFGIEVVDVSAALNAGRDRGLWEDDGAYSSLGHSIVSRAIGVAMQDD